jgi:hypothetical protein
MKTWQKIAFPLTLAFGLAGCTESPRDVARKPAIVQQLVENAASICDTGADGTGTYEQRLTGVLTGAKTADLQVLLDHHVTPCLDRRLSQTSLDFWHGRLAGFFYASKGGQNGGGKDGGVLSLRDDGKPIEQSIWSMNTYSRGVNDVKSLAGKINDGEQSHDGGYMAGYEGKGGWVRWGLRTAEAGVFKDYPGLLTPPVKSAPPKPAS